MTKIISTYIFTTSKLDANHHLRTNKVQELVGYITKCSESGEAVDIGCAAFQTALNLLSNTMFSKDMADPYHGNVAKEFKETVWSIRASPRASLLGPKYNIKNVAPTILSTSLLYFIFYSYIGLHYNKRDGKMEVNWREGFFYCEKIS